MTFTEWMQGHRRSILFLLVLLALAGALAAFKLPVTLFPTVDFPRVVVSLDAGDRPADLMMLAVTQPVEEVLALAHAGGITHGLVLDALFHFETHWQKMKKQPG